MNKVEVYVVWRSGPRLRPGCSTVGLYRLLDQNIIKTRPLRGSFFFFFFNSTPTSNVCKHITFDSFCPSMAKWSTR